ncbi:MAG: hypothetical protein J5820_02855, partial [Rhodocyclaceae bacterium]|nr:hypothetical protein [Rhodocyclaceae bacterium]
MNVIAHMRLTNFDGGKTLFVEELQSDWAQDKRAAKSVPDAPFVGSTGKWLDLLLKNVLIEAANGRYSRVSFVTGEQSSERYSLHTQVDSLRYDGHTLFAQPRKGGQELIHDATPEQLPEFVGKEIAERLIAEQRAHGEAMLEGNGLRVTNAGMHEFYDKIVPRAMEKLLRKLDKGARLERVLQEETGAKQWSFALSDAMRDKLAEGLPLFRRAEPVQGTAQTFAQWKREIDAGETDLKYPDWLKHGTGVTQADVEAVRALNEAMVRYGLG